MATTISGSVYTWPNSDRTLWLDLLHGLLAPIPSLLAFPIALAWWLVALVGVLYPLYDWSMPRDRGGVPA
jgi:hypothetical protein